MVPSKSYPIWTDVTHSLPKRVKEYILVRFLEDSEEDFSSIRIIEVRIFSEGSVSRTLYLCLVERRVRDKLFRTLVKQEIGFFDETPTGMFKKIMGRLYFV